MRYKRFVKRLMSMPAVRGWWSRQGFVYSDPFKSLVDDIAAGLEADDESGVAEAESIEAP